MAAHGRERREGGPEGQWAERLRTTRAGGSGKPGWLTWKLSPGGESQELVPQPLCALRETQLTLWTV